MGKAIFIEDSQFEKNLLHWKGSLNPIGDKFRSVADRYARELRRQALKESGNAKSQSNELLDRRFTKTYKQKYKIAISLAYSLQKYAELVYAVEIHGSDQNYAVVASGHAASLAIEFGGHDNVIMAGSEPLVYPAMRLLGRTLA
jgi:hypothetical protein